ncbi:MAG: hypothetical protein IPM18_12945 [Phycisphaerales bacterium]|nr:hypothetical protein [Phycisphaerales bacterium]
MEHRFTIGKLSLLAHAVGVGSKGPKDSVAMADETFYTALVDIFERMKTAGADYAALFRSAGIDDPAILWIADEFAAACRALPDDVNRLERLMRDEGIHPTLARAYVELASYLADFAHDLAERLIRTEYARRLSAVPPPAPQ